MRGHTGQRTGRNAAAAALRDAKPLRPEGVDRLRLRGAWHQVEVSARDYIIYLIEVCIVVKGFGVNKKAVARLAGLAAVLAACGLDTLLSRLDGGTDGPSTYTIVLNPQGGSDGTDTVQAAKGQQLPQIAPPLKDGFSFGGYTAGRMGSGRGTTPRTARAPPSGPTTQAARTARPA